jgi:hypothetical protein
MLVHMAPNEVGALQGLARAAGGSLTINPQTGLAEAGFLKSILPMIAGAGLSMIPGVGPLMAAGLVGGATGLATGSLEKGLMAGLGAYGGAGIGSGLGAMGAGTASSAATPLTTTGVKLGEAASSASLGGGLSATPSTLPAALESATTAAAPTTNTAAYSLTPNAPQIALDTGGASQFNLLNPADKGVLGASTASTPTSFAAMSPADKLAAIGRGATAENVLNYATTNPTTTAAAFAPLAMDAMTPKPYKDKEDSDPGQQYTFEANPTVPTPEVDPSGRGQRYFDPRYIRAAQGGIMQGLSSKESHLGSYSDGGRLLRGPGDGVSDSIPATIGGKQPARLADGEFVIPARIVSELGNGSTEAGAKQLYAMMDRIQRARRKTTGKKQVAKKTNARKMMPA